jgi:hypothetical protein
MQDCKCDICVQYRHSILCKFTIYAVAITHSFAYINILSQKYLIFNWSKESVNVSSVKYDFRYIIYDVTPDATSNCTVPISIFLHFHLQDLSVLHFIQTHSARNLSAASKRCFVRVFYSKLLCCSWVFQRNSRHGNLRHVCNKLISLIRFAESTLTAYDRSVSNYELGKISVSKLFQ